MRKHADTKADTKDEAGGESMLEKDGEMRTTVLEMTTETAQELGLPQVLPTTHVNAAPLGASVPAVQEPKAPTVITHDVASMMLEDADLGVSTDAKDNTVPFMRVLQALSPQLDDTNAKHIEGAKIGDILLPNYAGRIVPGAKGILFQPCFFYKAWPEFIPRTRGGGFKGRYENRVATRADVARLRGRVTLGEDIPDIEEDVTVRKGDAGFPVWERPAAGTDLIYTRYHPGFAIFEDGQVLPYVIDMKSTGHKISKNWMSVMGSHRQANGRIEPSWARLYRITTAKTSNAKGTFAQYVIEECPGLVDTPAYLRGRDLYKSFDSGAVVLDEDMAPDEGDGSAGGGGGYSDDVPY
jgi:hypothetical protein